MPFPLGHNTKVGGIRTHEIQEPNGEVTITQHYGIFLLVSLIYYDINSLAFKYNFVNLNFYLFKSTSKLFGLGLKIHYLLQKDDYFQF